MNPLRAGIATVAFLASSFLAIAAEPVEWIKSWERFVAPPSKSVLLVRMSGNPELSAVLAQLPPPERWPELVEALSAAEKAATTPTRKQNLRAGRWLVLEMLGRGVEVAAEVEAARLAGEIEDEIAQRLTEALGKNEAATPELQVKGFEAAVAEHAAATVSFGSGDYYPGIETPDLVTLVGAERAEALLRKALVVRATLEIPDAAEPTLKLARKLATELAPKLRAPQWGLCEHPDALALFEAMRPRFKARADGHDYKYDQALAYYIVGLILTERTDDALREATAAKKQFSLPYDLGERLGRGGYEAAVHAFLHRLLEQKPDSDDGLWSSYRRLSVQLEKRDEMVALIRAQAADTTLKGAGKVRAAQRLALAEIALDDVAAGVPRLRAALTDARALKGESKLVSNLADDLFKVARVQADEAAAGEALAALGEQARASLAGGGESYEVSSAVENAMAALLQAGREAEALALADEFEAWVRGEQVEAAKPNAHKYMSDDILADTLLMRLRLLVAQEKWEEAERLITQHEGWGSADAAAQIKRSYGGRDTEAPFGVLVARVLRARGDTEGARRALETQLGRTAGSDSAYAEYIELRGADAAPLLDKLFALDPYEERPIIWKAVLASRAKNWPEAERLARLAVSVDPSDGEQGRGDRMRVYAVLGEARAAQGDETEAAFFGRVVRAIRLSETADGWHEAGLFSRSIKGYRDALDLFADAYCVQSRLAIRLAGEGRMDEAMEHYRKAYELMPGSFGRVESHCFGCERAFDGPKQQGVAEEVFTRMAAADPKKAQVPYLLGYLREEQERLAEAVELYDRAVALDPLYLNAWKKISALADRMAVPVARRDEVALRLIELDPLGRHSSPDLARIADGAALWRALVAAELRAKELPRHESVLPMKQSAKARQNTSSYNRDEAERRSPAQVFSERAFARAIEQQAAMLRYSR